MMDEDASKIRAALELLRVPRPKQRRENSWIKMQLSTEAGGMCMVGALMRAYDVTDGDYQQFWGDNRSSEGRDANAILKAINDQYPDERHNVIPSWNDTTGRTFEEVERVMEKAAVMREEEGARSDWTIG